MTSLKGRGLFKNQRAHAQVAGTNYQTKLLQMKSDHLEINVAALHISVDELYAELRADVDII
jgi:hypothetical protein